jgi:hypothetical protein
MGDIERVVGLIIMINISLVTPGFQTSCGIFQDDMISRMYYPDTGHEYALIEVWLPWREAQAYCENLGGYLATISSASENEFVENIADPINDDVWIGLTDEANEGNWEWVTGERLMFVNWEYYNPDGGEGENYVEMHRDGTWNDLPVTSSMCFVCEWGDYQISKPEDFPPIVGRILLFLLVVSATLVSIRRRKKSL